MITKGNLLYNVCTTYIKEKHCMFRHCYYFERILSENSTLLSGAFLDIVLYFSDVLKEHFTLYSRISSSFEWLIKHTKLVLWGIDQISKHFKICHYSVNQLAWLMCVKYYRWRFDRAIYFILNDFQACLNDLQNT